MRERFARFMAGRNGNDQLNLFLLGVAVVLAAISAFFRSGGFGSFLSAVVLALLAYVYFRMLSRNVYKRREENGKFMRFRYDMEGRLRAAKERWVQRKDYKFFSCPSCHTNLRVPRGKGRIKIVCRKCGTSFMGRS